MTRWIAVVSAITMALVGALGVSVTLADSSDNTKEPSKYQVEVAVDPQFPVVGQEATLTLRISHDGDPQGGLALTLDLAHVDTDDHHGEEESQEAVKEGGGMAGMAGKQETDVPQVEDNHGGDAPEPVETPSSHSEAGIMPDANSGEQIEQPQEHAEATTQVLETAPGVYVAKYTFTEGGRWEAKAEMEGEHVDWIVGVRNAPVAWPFLGGMGAIVAGTAAVVAVVKTTKKEW